MADDVGALIGRYRRSKGMTQEQAAAAWGVPLRTLQGYETRGAGASAGGVLAAALRDALGDDTAGG